MFTLQSGQIENALRTVGIPDISAREMMSGIANCQATIEHRGPVALTRPTINYFPTVRPSVASGNPRFTSQTPNTTIKLPPWQSVPFTPIPYFPMPPWETIPYPDWPPTPPGEPTFSVDGPVEAGQITTPAANITNLTTNNITNQGDITNAGDIVNQGDITNEGDVHVSNDLTVQNNFTTNGPVTNYGPVYNAGETINNVTHNQYTVNHGPTYHHSETHFDGPNVINGPTIVNGPTYLETNIYVNGDPLEAVTLDVVTDVSWDGTVLSQTKRNVRVFGKLGASTTTTVLDCDA